MNFSKELIAGTRRNYLAAMTAALALPSWLKAADTNEQSDRWGALLPTRAIGPGKERITILGLGGAHFARLKEDSQLQRCIETAIEGGVRFFDTAHKYGKNQRSEKLYGQFLTPKYRDEIFLMSKTHTHTAKDAREQFETSLKNMKTDRLDLLMVHQLETAEDVNARLAGGVFDEFIKLRQEGKARYIGVSGHSDYRAILRFLEVSKEHGFAFDTCQIPVNLVDSSFNSYLKNAVPALNEQGVGVLAMKTMSGGRLTGGPAMFGNRKKTELTGRLIPDQVSFNDAVAFVLSQAITSRIFGFQSILQVEENIAAAKAFRPLSEKQLQQLEQESASYAGANTEYYKSPELIV